MTKRRLRVIRKKNLKKGPTEGKKTFNGEKISCRKGRKEAKIGTDCLRGFGKGQGEAIVQSQGVQTDEKALALKGALVN